MCRDKHTQELVERMLRWKTPDIVGYAAYLEYLRLNELNADEFDKEYAAMMEFPEPEEISISWVVEAE